MSAAAARALAAAAPRTEGGPIEAYRDDGPLASALGLLGRLIPLPPALLLFAGVAPFMAVLGLEGDGASRALVGALLALLVVAGGVSSGRPHTDRFRWAIPVQLRAVEYAGVLWLASLDGSSSYPAAFALLAAVAFRHYDLFYRLRYRGVMPPMRVSLVGGGWDGRLLLAYVFLVTGALPAGLFAAAIALATVFVSDSALGWIRQNRAQAPVAYEDEEDEGH
jgi:Family of unknown function (DUF5941)